MGVPSGPNISIFLENHVFLSTWGQKTSNNSNFSEKQTTIILKNSNFALLAVTLGAPFQSRTRAACPSAPPSYTSDLIITLILGSIENLCYNEGKQEV